MVLAKPFRVCCFIFTIQNVPIKYYALKYDVKLK